MIKCRGGGVCLKDGEGRTEINLVVSFGDEYMDPDMGRRVQCSAVSLGAFTVETTGNKSYVSSTFFMGGKVRG